MLIKPSGNRSADLRDRRAGRRRPYIFPAVGGAPGLDAIGAAEWRSCPTASCLCRGRILYALRSREIAGSGDEACGQHGIRCCCSGLVPVAVRGSEVLGFVVPGTAAQDPPTGGRSGSRDGHPPRKIAWRSRQRCRRVRRERSTRRRISSRETRPATHFARRLRRRLWKRRTFSSGSRRPLPGCRTNLRNAAGSLVSTMRVLTG